MFIIILEQTIYQDPPPQKKKSIPQHPRHMNFYSERLEMCVRQLLCGWAAVIVWQCLFMAVLKALSCVHTVPFTAQVYKAGAASLYSVYPPCKHSALVWGSHQQTTGVVQRRKKKRWGERGRDTSLKEKQDECTWSFVVVREGWEQAVVQFWRKNNKR